jgi:hypothetical protein
VKKGLFAAGGKRKRAGSVFCCGSALPEQAEAKTVAYALLPK